MPFYTIKEAIRSGRRLKLSLAEGDRFDNPRPGYKPNDPAMKGGIIEYV